MRRVEGDYGAFPRDRVITALHDLGLILRRGDCADETIVEDEDGHIAVYVFPPLVPSMVIQRLIHTYGLDVILALQGKLPRPDVN